MTVPNAQRLTPSMIRKGKRLYREGKVRFAGLLPVYLVTGDHDEYPVIAYADSTACPCPHHGTACSHGAAVHEHRAHDPHPPQHILPTDVVAGPLESELNELRNRLDLVRAQRDEWEQIATSYRHRLQNTGAGLSNIKP